MKPVESNEIVAPTRFSPVATDVLVAVAIQKTIAAGMLLTALILGSVACAQGVDPRTAPADDVAKRATSPEELVRQLDAAEFKKREAAERALIALGAKALPAVRAGVKSPRAEVAQRCQRLLPLIRKAELARFAKAFNADADRKATFEHPIWKRYVSMVGDSKASRGLLAAIIKGDPWLQQLDDAEADPARAGEIYQAAVRDVGKRYTTNLNVRFLIPIWPCDQPEEVAFLLLLGGYRGTDRDYPLSYQKIPDREFADGEGRIRHAQGLSLGLQGKRLAIDPKKRDRSIIVADGYGNAAETGRVMLMLLGHWLEQRNCWPVVSEHLKALSAEQAKQLVPFARRVIADKTAPVLCRAAWISVLRRFGDKADADLLSSLFEDKSGMDWPSTTRFGDGPGNLRNQAEVREVAIGSAVFLRGGDPARMGFTCLANQKPAKKREDDIHSTLFAVLTPRREETELVLRKAVQWLADEAKRDESAVPTKRGQPTVPKN